MATTTRPELSNKSQWHISKHRYYELKHFCMQYPEWVEMMKDIDGLPRMSAFVREPVNEGRTGDPTACYAETREFLSHRIELITRAAYEVCGHQFWHMILVEAVTTNVSYDILQARKGIMPVSRDEWYDIYRKFFWYLDKMRE